MLVVVRIIHSNKFVIHIQIRFSHSNRSPLTMRVIISSNFQGLSAAFLALGLSKVFFALGLSELFLALGLSEVFFTLGLSELFLALGLALSVFGFFGLSSAVFCFFAALPLLFLDDPLRLM